MYSNLFKKQHTYTMKMELEAKPRSSAKIRYIYTSVCCRNANTSVGLLYYRSIKGLYHFIITQIHMCYR